MGKMRAYLPYMGMFTIWLNDYPLFKYAVLGLMGFFVLIAKDPQWNTLSIVKIAKFFLIDIFKVFSIKGSFICFIIFIEKRWYLIDKLFKSIFK